MNNNINYPRTSPASNYSGVTINITSPTVNANTGKCGCSQPLCRDNQIPDNNVTIYPYASYENNQQLQAVTTQHQLPAYPQQYYMNNYNYAPMPPYNTNRVDTTYANSQGYSNYSLPKDTTDDTISQDIIANLNKMADEQRKLEKNGKEIKIVALTNEYIKSLENYLNNPNKEIRQLASVEILTRLNEDKNRYNDIALNALINKMLQDPDKIIRTAAISALSSGLASGNDYTVKLLEDMQKNPEADEADAVDAANILLKHSTQVETKYIPQPVSSEKLNIATNQTSNISSVEQNVIPAEDRIAFVKEGHNNEQNY